MKIRKYASWMCGLASAALLILPGANAFADTSSPVTCKDGTTSPHGGRGSCSGHGGIDKAATAAAAATPAAPTPAAKPAPAAAAPTPAPASPAASAGRPDPSKAPPASQAAAPGGGPGMVWVNSASKVYHCPSDRWYGKTKAGEYMTEADAKAKGNRADHNKPCS
jgi:hypothetical protein